MPHCGPVPRRVVTGKLGPQKGETTQNCRAPARAHAFEPMLVVGREVGHCRLPAVEPLEDQWGTPGTAARIQSTSAAILARGCATRSFTCQLW